MKKTVLPLIVALPLALSLGGCVVSVDTDDYDHGYSSWGNMERKNREKISNLSTDLSVQQVKQRMGTPAFHELYKQGDDTIQVFFYRTNRREGDGITTKDECTPLVFKNDLLVGWGETAYGNI